MLTHHKSASDDPFCIWLPKKWKWNKVQFGLQNIKKIEFSVKGPSVQIHPAWPIQKTQGKEKKREWSTSNKILLNRGPTF